MDFLSVFCLVLLMLVLACVGTVEMLLPEIGGFVGAILMLLFMFATIPSLILGKATSTQDRTSVFSFVRVIATSIISAATPLFFLFSSLVSCDRIEAGEHGQPFQGLLVFWDAAWKTCLALLVICGLAYLMGVMCDRVGRGSFGRLADATALVATVVPIGLVAMTIWSGACAHGREALSTAYPIETQVTLSKTEQPMVPLLQVFEGHSYHERGITGIELPNTNPELPAGTTVGVSGYYYKADDQTYYLGYADDSYGIFTAESLGLPDRESFTEMVKRQVDEH